MVLILGLEGYLRFGWVRNLWRCKNAFWVAGDSLSQCVKVGMNLVIAFLNHGACDLVWGLQKNIWNWGHCLHVRRGEWMLTERDIKVGEIIGGQSRRMLSFVITVFLSGCGFRWNEILGSLKCFPSCKDLQPPIEISFFLPVSFTSLWDFWGGTKFCSSPYKGPNAVPDTQ